jgi:hypothetical protein
MIKCSPECPGIRGLKVGGGKCGGKFGDGTANGGASNEPQQYDFTLRRRVSSLDATKGTPAKEAQKGALLVTCASVIQSIQLQRPFTDTGRL